MGKDINKIKNNAIKYAEQNYNLINEVGDTIWRFAEIHRQEYHSSRYLTDKLTTIGYSVKTGTGGFPTGFTGEYTRGNGPVIGLLCEYDALEGLSSTEPGKPGHGCGHNLFSAGAIGAAYVVKKIMEEENFCGTIKIFGNPSEENYGSKQFYAKQGVYDGVDVMFSFHPLEENAVFYKQHNAIIAKKYQFHGKSAHAAVNPEDGRSALNAVEIMNIAVNYMRGNVTSDVRVNYIITSGGMAPNIVPEFAESNYTIRAQEMDNLNKVVTRVDKIAQAAAIAAECEVMIKYCYGLANTIINRSFAEIAQRNIEYAGPPSFDEEDMETAKKFGTKKGLFTNIDELPQQIGICTGSTDEADVSWIVPWVRITMATAAIGSCAHTVDMTRQVNMPAAYKGVCQTVKAVACTIIDLLTDKNEMQKIKDCHRENMHGRTYDRNHRYPDASYFLNAPGVKVLSGNKLSVNLNDTILLSNTNNVTITVYKNNNMIGHCLAENCNEDYYIDLTAECIENETLILKYRIAYDEDEALLGYIKC